MLLRKGYINGLVLNLTRLNQKLDPSKNLLKMVTGYRTDFSAGSLLFTVKV